MAGYVVFRLAPRVLQKNSFVLQPTILKNCTGIWLKNRHMSSWTERKNSVVTGKSEYDIEVEKISKKENFRHYYGFNKHNAFLDKAEMDSYFFGVVSCLTFFMIIMCYAPDIKSQMRGWKKREAIRLIEQREAAGELLINPDFCPMDKIADMVPAEGDWEEQWLRDQPAIMTDARPTYYTMVDTN